MLVVHLCCQSSCVQQDSVHDELQMLPYRFSPAHHSVHNELQMDEAVSDPPD